MYFNKSLCPWMYENLSNDDSDNNCNDNNFGYNSHYHRAGTLINYQQQGLIPGCYKPTPGYEFSDPAKPRIWNDAKGYSVHDHAMNPCPMYNTMFTIYG